MSRTELDQPEMASGPIALIPEDPRAVQVRAVLALIHDGSSENSACLEVGINRATFRAAALRVGAGDSYARALEALAQDQVEKVEQAITDMRDGTIKPEVARIEIDARKWFASKFFPRQYGDKVQQEVSGGLSISWPLPKPPLES